MRLARVDAWENIIFLTAVCIYDAWHWLVS